MGPEELDDESRGNKTEESYLLKIFLISFHFVAVCETDVMITTKLFSLQHFSNTISILHYKQHRKHV